MLLISAPAKVNLTLSVLGKRDDGYHQLESLMQMLALADMLRFDVAPNSEILFSCSDPQLSGPNNLVMQAAQLLQSRCSRPRGVKIHLEKRIPVQAGLGGGSSDAAATLTALNEFWNLHLSGETLAILAAQLGSDVPFFLNGPTALVRGRGEAVMSVSHRAVGHVVLVKGEKGLSTATVYARLNVREMGAMVQKTMEPRTEAMWRALQHESYPDILQALHNDLELPAFALLPDLKHTRECMLRAGCDAALLCGSGATLFGLCPDEKTAQRAVHQLAKEFCWTWAGDWLLCR